MVRCKEDGRERETERRGARDGDTEIMHTLFSLWFKEKMLQLIKLQIHVSAGSLREKSAFVCCQTLGNVQKLLGRVMYFSFCSRRGSLYIFLSPIFDFLILQ